MATQTIKLKTTQTQSGKTCVRRNGPPMPLARKDADVIEFENENQSDSGKNITLSFDPAEAAKLFSPVPPESSVLLPKMRVGFTVRDDIGGTVGIKFRTNPADCKGANEDDIVIHC